MSVGLQNQDSIVEIRNEQRLVSDSDYALIFLQKKNLIQCCIVVQKQLRIIHQVLHLRSTKAPHYDNAF